MTPIRSDVPAEIAVFRCDRCQRRAETPTSSPAPECGEYIAPTRQTFPDGSWINLGESYTPHGPMADTGERLDGNPLASYRDDERRAQKLELARAERDARWKREQAALELATNVSRSPAGSDVPASVGHMSYDVTCRHTACGRSTKLRPSLIEKGAQVMCPGCGNVLAYREDN